MHLNLKNFIVKYLPGLGKFKRLFIAFADSLSSAKSTYSQHGEDKYIVNQLQNYDLSKGIYVDVGANHPSLISNTFIFYKQGYKGVVIEPNGELLKLFKIFRKRDLAIGIGCGLHPDFKLFYLSKTPVLSSFNQNSIVQLSSISNIWKQQFLPILPLNMVMSSIEYIWVFLLSIDVEGLDFECLKGASEVIKNTLFVLIESNNLDVESEIKEFLENNGFVFDSKFECNQLFKNLDKKFNIYLKK